VKNEARWDSLTELFDRLLTAADPAAVLAAEPDPELRQAAEALWKHHLEASSENFLGRSLEFEVVPMFQPGRVLANRFRIERMLGRGGMGEVYLAADMRMEHELVALKTVARLLTPSVSVRRRIAAEVQNARRVTHPNVCRIHELFEDGETLFFSMEFVEGRLLSDLLGEPSAARNARLLVRQMAEGLEAAHKTGVVHGDFKPGNVIVAGSQNPRVVIMDFGLARALDRTDPAVDRRLSLRGGTAEYMAPELHSGSPPSVRSDIFAFGMVARQLMPGERLWDECTQHHPEDRPDSLAAILAHLELPSSRRAWMAAVFAMSAGALGYSLWPRPERNAGLPNGARVLVNGFRSDPGGREARLARSLLLTTLQQSPRLHVIADQDVLPLVKKVAPQATGMPFSGPLLRDLLKQLRAAFWIDADFHQHASRYSLNLTLMRVSDGQTITEAAIRDRPGIVDLVQHAALWLRSFSGESERSLAVNPVAVGSYTSKVPEALQRYYDAMEHYALAEMDRAIPLLEQAVNLDPGFAQAHSMLGMCLNPTGAYDRAFVEVALAKDLAMNARYPERERAWILTNYYTLCEDPLKMVEAAKANADYYPDEPRFQRVLAHTLCRTRRAAEGIVHNRKAVDLAPNDDLQRWSLMDTLCEAGQFQDALNEFQTAMARGATDPWLYNAVGIAYLGLERYQEARDAFEHEPDLRNRNLDIQRVNAMEGDFDRAIIGMREYRAGARNAVDAHQANEFLCGLYYLTDRPDLALGPLREMADLPAYPPLARNLDCTAFWARRIGADDVLAEAHDRLAKIRESWENDFTRTAERHASALQSWRAGALPQAESQLLDASDLALSPWRLFDAAEFFAASGHAEIAADYWRQFEEHRGTVVVLWFPGALVMAWLGQAALAQARRAPAEARKYSRRILDHWGAKNPGLKIVRAAWAVQNASRSL